MSNCNPHITKAIKIVPQKSETEAILNRFYMPYIRLNGIIPQHIVEQFLKDVAIIEKRYAQIN